VLPPTPAVTGALFRTPAPVGGLQNGYPQRTRSRPSVTFSDPLVHVSRVRSCRPALNWGQRTRSIANDGFKFISPSSCCNGSDRLMRQSDAFSVIVAKTPKGLTNRERRAINLCGDSVAWRPSTRMTRPRRTIFVQIARRGCRFWGSFREVWTNPRRPDRPAPPH